MNKSTLPAVFFLLITIQLPCGTTGDPRAGWRCDEVDTLLDEIWGYYFQEQFEQDATSPDVSPLEYQLELLYQYTGIGLTSQGGRHQLACQIANTTDLNDLSHSLGIPYLRLYHHYMLVQNFLQRKGGQENYFYFLTGLDLLMEKLGDWVRATGFPETPVNTTYVDALEFFSALRYEFSDSVFQAIDSHLPFLWELTPEELARAIADAQDERELIRDLETSRWAVWWTRSEELLERRIPPLGPLYTALRTALELHLLPVDYAGSPYDDLYQYITNHVEIPVSSGSDVVNATYIPSQTSPPWPTEGVTDHSAADYPTTPGDRPASEAVQGYDSTTSVTNTVGSNDFNSSTENGNEYMPFEASSVKTVTNTDSAIQDLNLTDVMGSGDLDVSDEDSATNMGPEADTIIPTTPISIHDDADGMDAENAYAYEMFYYYENETVSLFDDYDLPTNDTDTGNASRTRRETSRAVECEDILSLFSEVLQASQDSQLHLYEDIFVLSSKLNRDLLNPAVLANLACELSDCDTIDDVAELFEIPVSILLEAKTNIEGYANLMYGGKRGMEGTADVYDVMIEFADITGFPTFPLRGISFQDLNAMLRVVKVADTPATRTYYGTLLHDILPIDILHTEEITAVLLTSHSIEECYQELYRRAHTRPRRGQIASVRHKIEIDMPVTRTLLRLSAKALGLAQDMGFLAADT